MIQFFWYMIQLKSRLNHKSITDLSYLSSIYDKCITHIIDFIVKNDYFTISLVLQPRVLMDLWLRMIPLSIESWFPDVFIEIIAVNMRFITSLSVSNCCLLLLLYFLVDCLNLRMCFVTSMMTHLSKINGFYTVHLSTIFI